MDTLQQVNQAISRQPAGGTLPVAEEITFPLTAWEAARRLADLPHLLFLDSAQGGTLGRYSFVTGDPFEWITARENEICVNGVKQLGSDPFAVLDDRLAAYREATLPDLPPFQGGAAGLFGYDLCHHLERLPRPRFADFPVPDLAVGLYDWVLAFDHWQNRSWLICTGFPERDPERRLHRARRRLRQSRRRLGAPPPSPHWKPQRPAPLPTPQFPVASYPGLTSDFSRAAYLDTVARAVEYVHAGDCFQVNIAQALSLPLAMPPLELYARLRERNAAPFAGYFDLGDFALASASPERFVRVRDGQVETRPIKGTRPRGLTPEEDFARRQDLRESDKDRAENVMIVDLLRNDLGRVCRYGSIEVEALCRLESHPFVHHLVSVVRGQLREGKGPVDLLRASFPGGSVTGAPKIRAMEIIAELEPTARGPYCGCLGYLGFDGSMDANILIRTFLLGHGWARFSVGGGIVADSEPQKEYEETWHKAEGLLRALGA